jgi:hypothetical protein
MDENVCVHRPAEFFLGKFPKMLTKWLESLVEKRGRFSAIVPNNWTSEFVRKFNSVSNPTTREVDFCLDSVLRGYVIEFAVDCIQSYNIAEIMFLKGGPHGRFLKSLNMWINMLLCEKNVMIMNSND